MEIIRFEAVQKMETVLHRMADEQSFLTEEDALTRLVGAASEDELCEDELELLAAAGTPSLHMEDNLAKIMNRR